MCVCVWLMGGGLAPAFSVLGQCTMAESARPKTMTANTIAVHLKKSFTYSPPLKSYLKTCPRSYHRGGCRVLSGVSPHASRGAGYFSNPLRRWSLCVRLVLFCSALLFVLVLVFRHHHTSKTGFFLQMACPLLILM